MFIEELLNKKGKAKYTAFPFIVAKTGIEPVGPQGYEILRSNQLSYLARLWCKYRKYLFTTKIIST
jgi:hypothetical protein